MNTTQHVKSLVAAGLSKEEIKMIIDISDDYLYHILPSTKSNTKEQAIRLRESGHTYAQIASMLNISIGSVQNFLRAPKKMIKRTSLEGYVLYFYSIAHVLQYHPELYRKSLYKLIRTGEQYWGYTFQFISPELEEINSIQIASYQK